MNNRAHKPFFLRRRFSAAGLCALAILILLVSCPLKRMLYSNAVSLTSIQKSKPATSSRTVLGHYAKSTYDCAAQKKEPFVNVGYTLKQVVSPFYFPGDQYGSSFGIAYFLSRIKNQPASTTVSKISSLPLFLHQRRLLI
jgi:hypothetical protein